MKLHEIHDGKLIKGTWPSDVASSHRVEINSGAGKETGWLGHRHPLGGHPEGLSTAVGLGLSPSHVKSILQQVFAICF